jgi:ferritin-like metal-binding protein YciE
MAQATQMTMKQSNGGGTSMQNAQDLFLHELSDIRSAEQIILGMLETASGAATSAELRRGLEQHPEQTKGHLENVDAVFQAIGQEPEAIECKGARGLEAELQEALKHKPAPEVLDALIAGGAAKTEHYEISAYSGVVELAKLLGEKEAQKLLEENLKQEEETLTKVEAIEE